MRLVGAQSPEGGAGIRGAGGGGEEREWGGKEEEGKEEDLRSAE